MQLNSQLLWNFIL